MLTYQYNPKEHILLKNDLWHWLERQFPTYGLCLLFHRLHHTFTISRRSADHQLIDVMHLGRSLASFTRDQAFILRRLITQNPEYRKEIGQALSYREQSTLSRRQDQEMGKTERWERRRSSRVSVGYQSPG